MARGTCVICGSRRTEAILIEYQLPKYECGNFRFVTIKVCRYSQDWSDHASCRRKLKERVLEAREHLAILASTI